MKKGLSVFALLALVLNVSAAGAKAQEEAGQERSLGKVVTKKIITQQTEQAAVPVVSEQERAAISQQATRSLNAQTWTVYWSQQGVKKPAVITDVLTFSGNGVTSEYLTSKGFGGSNYALHVEDDRAAVWETVQRNADEDIAAWRGELRGDEIYGTVSIRDNDTGRVVLYSFSTRKP